MNVQVDRSFVSASFPPFVCSTISHSFLSVSIECFYCVPLGSKLTACFGNGGVEEKFTGMKDKVVVVYVY